MSSADRSTPYADIHEVERRNAEVGHGFFTSPAWRHMRARRETDLIRGRYFVTSELNPRGGFRRFTVRYANDDGTISTVGRFMEHATMREAMDAALAADAAR